MLNLKEEKEEKIYVNIKVEKPKKNENGFYYYKDAFIYLAKVLPENYPSYKIILNFASYAISHNGCLTNKQSKIADEIIEYFEDEEVL